MMRLKIRRLLASTIDYALILFSIILTWEILSRIWGEIIAKYYIYIPLGLFTVIAFFMLIIRKDLFAKNISIGKKLYQLKIVGENEKTIVNQDILIKRNIESMQLLNFPIYPFMILLNNKSKGDIKYSTKVIMTENFNWLPTIVVYILLTISSIL